MKLFILIFIFLVIFPRDVTHMTSVEVALCNKDMAEM